MQGSGEFIIHNIKAMFNDSGNIFVAPDIPDKKLKNASKAFKVDRESILALYDYTIFGAADEGIVFTGEKMIFKSASDVREVYYRDTKSLQIVLKSNEKKGKPPTKLISLETTNDGIIIVDYGIEESDKELFVDFIKKLLEECDIESSTNESVKELFKPLEDMSKELRFAFVKIIINMAFENEGQIDDKERSEIMLLVNRIKLEKEERFKILRYMAEIQKDLEPVNDLVEIIKKNCEKNIHYKAVMISLVQNLFNLYANTQTQEKEINLPATFEFLEKHKDIFNLSDDEINVAKSAVENDLRILYEEDMDSDKIKEITKDLMAKAASVGLPIGAVYVSGSVVGLSAAGMTSGLASLGFGGVLGLSSMATGIGVAVLLGVGVYQGIKYFTADNKQLEALKQREMMIQEVLKQTQKSISLMIEDINSIVQQLNDALSNNTKLGEGIEKCEKMLTLCMGAMSKTNEKYKQCENLKAHSQCPKILDVSRIGFLKEDNNGLYDFILSCYEEVQEIKENEKKEESIQMRLKQDLPTEQLEELSEILKELGYFDTANILKDKATSKAKGLLNAQKFFKR
ncbi:hypothetical protein [Helicobacter japonicus]|uniref:hypothetical protein n=1 Tax=Helicobacter japonicus TaxID=425400 RepID=UPI0023F1C65F|nr:hypothetical protein [Helicobacter japonicus]